MNRIFNQQRFLWSLGPAMPELELTEGGHSCPPLPLYGRLPAASPRRSKRNSHKRTQRTQRFRNENGVFLRLLRFLWLIPLPSPRALGRFPPLCLCASLPPFFLAARPARTKLLHPQQGRDGRVVECGGLENRCTARYRGFESLSLRHKARWGAPMRNEELGIRNVYVVSLAGGTVGSRKAGEGINHRGEREINHKRHKNHKIDHRLHG